MLNKTYITEMLAQLGDFKLENGELSAAVDEIVISQPSYGQFKVEFVRLGKVVSSVVSHQQVNGEDELSIKFGDKPAFIPFTMECQ